MNIWICCSVAFKYDVVALEKVKGVGWCFGILITWAPWNALRISKKVLSLSTSTDGPLQPQTPSCCPSSMAQMPEKYLIIWVFLWELQTLRQQHNTLSEWLTRSQGLCLWLSLLDFTFNLNVDLYSVNKTGHTHADYFPCPFDFKNLLNYFFWYASFLNSHNKGRQPFLIFKDLHSFHGLGQCRTFGFDKT